MPHVTQKKGGASEEWNKCELGKTQDHNTNFKWSVPLQVTWKGQETQCPGLQNIIA